MTRRNTSTGIGTTIITNMSMGPTCRLESRIRTGIVMRRSCIGIRIIPICITGTVTGTPTEGERQLI